MVALCHSHSNTALFIRHKLERNVFVNISDRWKDVVIPENVASKLAEQEAQDKKDIEDYEKYGEKEEEETLNTVIIHS